MPAITTYEKSGFIIEEEFDDGRLVKMKKDLESQSLQKDQIMVSIKCLVYNHAPYLRQCLDGFVMQKTNFRFEAIVHDDASTDGSAEIIKEYAEKYPEIIKPIYQKENQYSKHNGSITKTMNKKIKGKYVAFCEGDDYWTDSYKLQTQVDFMESHPEFTLVYHNVYIDNGERKDILFKDPSYHKNIPFNGNCVIDVIKKGGGYIPTCSMLFRSQYLFNQPDWMKLSPVGDYPLALYLAINGEIKYIDKLMSCYRIMSDGSWSQRMKSNIDKRIKFLRSYFPMWHSFNKWTNNKYWGCVFRYKYLSLFNELTKAYISNAISKIYNR